MMQIKNAFFLLAIFNYVERMNIISTVIVSYIKANELQILFFYVESIKIPLLID